MGIAPVLETERLRLRGHRLDDFVASCALGSDPQAVRFIFQKPLTPEEVWARLLRSVGHWAFLDHGLFVVEERSSGRMIGEVGLADFHRGLGDDFDGVPECAWMLSSEVHGQGYATEAVRAALGWMEARFAVPRTVCIIDPDNAASRRVARKLGYRVYGEADYKGKPVIKFERLA
ncbi:MAG: N-acetyltransferase [Rhizorhabdus sp.]|nr:N-acetyltransferase [Rhizorhabdus sp.]